MKKFLASATAVALTLSLGATTFAAGFGGSVSVNGVKLDTNKAPATTLAGGIPMRAVVEADGGYADWFQEENSSFFSIDDLRVTVDCKTGAVQVNGEAVTGVKAEFVSGTTFLPATILKDVPGYTVAVSGKDVTITTPNSDPLIKLARSIVDGVSLAGVAKNSVDQLDGFFGIQAANYDQVAPFFPMMNVKSDALFIGKVASGKMDAAKKELEARRAAIQKSFEQYLPDQLEQAKNGKVVTSGDYVMLIISADNDAAIKLFKDGIKNLK